MHARAVPVFKLKADFLKALAHPVRLQVIEFLKARESSVGEMVRELGVEQSGLSKHLAILKQAGIVASRSEKSSVYYSIRDRGIYDVLRPISEILRKHLSESSRILSRLART